MGDVSLGSGVSTINGGDYGVGAGDVSNVNATKVIKQEITPFSLWPFDDNLDPILGDGPSTFTRSTTGTDVDKRDGLVKTAAINVARFEANGVLIEGASTNLLLRSEEFDNAAWTKSSGVAISADSTNAPDNNVTADKATPSTGGSFVEVLQDVSITIGNIYSQTYYVKDDGLQYIQIIGPGGSFGTFNVNFDLVNGVVSDNNTGTSVNLSFSISSAANGFFRIHVSAEALSTSSTGRLAINFIKTATTGRGVDEGNFDGTSAVFLWGSQLEQVAFPTSYIPTTTTTVTRTSDNLSIPSTNIPAPTADYSICITSDFLGLDSTKSQVIFNVEGETSRKIEVNTTTGLIECTHGAVTSTSTTAITAGVPMEICFTVGSTNQTLYINGVQEDQDAKGTVTGTATSISIGKAGSADYQYGHNAGLKIYSSELTADQV